MKIRMQYALLLLNTVSVLLIIVIAFTQVSALRIILGLPFLLFIPGYTLLSAILPKRDSLGNIERLVFSIGLSIAITILTGLILNYTPWGISLYAALISIALLILITSSIGWYRWRRLSDDERPSYTVSINISRWADMGAINKVLSVSLVVALVIALGCLGYIIARPQGHDGYTEFYILGTEAKADNYPRQVVAGETVEVTIGIVNHEFETTSYQINIEMEDGQVGQIEADTLADGEKWEEVMSFMPRASGENQKVEFWLYKDRETKPYFEDPLHLYLDVEESSSYE